MDNLHCEEIYHVEITRVAATGMYFGFCLPLVGFHVHGRNVEELETRIPAAIRKCLEDVGQRIEDVTRIEDEIVDGVDGKLSIRPYKVKRVSALVLN